MTNYTKTTDFAAKDALPSGNSAKIVKGSEIDTEFNNIATASATKANANAAALTGTTTFETISDGTISITAFVDEDNMASNSATLLPTQQSVKAYVDSQVTAQDLDFQADSGGALSIDLDSETLTFTGGTGVDTSGSGNAVTFAIDSTVATLTGSQTLSNKTLAAPVVSGNLTTDGLLDGRDVAADGTKLDGIEAGATADQTAAEIRALVESATDSNVFTDADHSKLNGIEASADVTDTANVTAAGALMDSELTSEASVKALNQGVATTDSPSFAGLTTTGNISFGDNDKAIFGAGSDLQIYHDGTHSYVRDEGTGGLILTTNGAAVYIQKGDTETSAEFNIDGAVKLRHDNAQKFSTTSTGIDVTGDVSIGDGSASATRLLMGSGDDSKMFHNGTDTYWINDTGNIIIRNQSDDKDILFQTDNGSGGTTTYITVDGSETDVSLHYGGNQKLATTSTGIDVTGTVTADGLTVDGNASAQTYRSSRTDGDVYIQAATDTDFVRIGTQTKPKLFNIDGSGDISFYEDTGTTAKLFWDASAESLGIGTSSVNYKLNVLADAGSQNIFQAGQTGVSNGLSITSDGSALTYSFLTGNVGIGTSSPTAGYNNTSALDVSGPIVSRGAISAHQTNAGVFQYNANETAIRSYGATSGSGLITFSTGGGGAADTERMRILSGGNITIGTVDAYFYSNASSGGTTIDAGFKLESSNQALGFWTADTERMRLDASGNLLVGTSSTASGGPYRVTADGGNSYRPLACKYDSTSGATQIAFINPNGQVGGITTTGSATAYNTSSDQRLKENIADADDAGSKIDAIQVRSFDWKADGSHQKYGMVAQELQSVAPEAVSGDADSDDMMGVDYSKLVPMMLKEIQSLRARVAQLENN